MFGRIKFLLVFILCLSQTSNLFAGNDEAALIRAYQSEKDGTKRFNRLLALGEYYQRNNIQKADSIRNYLLASSRQESDLSRFKALLFDLEVEGLNGNQTAYYSKIIELTPFLNRLKSSTSKITIFQLLAKTQIASREFPQAEIYLEEAMKISRQIRSYECIGRTYELYATLEKERNNKVRALNYVDQAIGFARRSPSRSLVASCVNTQAKIYSYFGQIELSVSKNYIALQLAKEANDYPKVANYQREIGEAQFTIYNYREAAQFFEWALETAERIKDNRMIGITLANQGMVSLAKRDLGKATTQLKNSIKILQRFNDLDGLGKSHMLLGNVFREKASYNDALRYYNQALVYFESVANRAEIASVYHLVGTVFEKQGKYANALNYLNRSVEIRSEFGYQGAIYPSYRAIAEVYKKTGNLKLAYKYLEMYSNFSDSSKIIEVSSKIAEISELYRAEQRERLIAIQADSIELNRKERDLTQVQLENTELRNTSQTYIIIGFLLVLIFGAVILYSRWKQRDIKQQQKEAEMNQVLLRSQMNPHFVFNAMSVIQSYIYENDIKNSTKFLVNFSKLMRLILENSSKEFIPLSTEIDILTKYLDTQKLRFGERFEYSVEVDDDFIEQGVVIPPMIAQPFIENALEHGQLHTIEGGFIRIRISKDEDLLHLTIEDNGVGRKGSENNKKSKAHKSMAMKITQDRIDNLSYKYRIQGRMEIDDYNKEQQTGTLVNIYLPFRTEIN
jgi:tetratricopeptide (TPR) repeat protein/two-component sensor histidine kinase